MIYPSIRFRTTTLLPIVKEGDIEERLGDNVSTIYDSMGYLESLGIILSLSQMYNLKKASKIYQVPKGGFKNLKINYKSDQILAKRLFDKGYDFHVKVERLT